MLVLSMKDILPTGIVNPLRSSVQVVVVCAVGCVCVCVGVGGVISYRVCVTLNLNTTLKVNGQPLSSLTLVYKLLHVYLSSLIVRVIIYNYV